MSTQHSERFIPQLTLGWRLKMSLGDMKRDDMAAILGVNPATVSRWMAGKGAEPKRAYVIQWALATGVDEEWLLTGRVPGAPQPPSGEPAPVRDQLAALTEAKRRRTRSGRSSDTIGVCAGLDAA